MVTALQRLLILMCAAAGVAGAQPFQTLLSFGGGNGDGPSYEALVQGAGGELWGTTFRGGQTDNGEIFKIAPDGTLTVMHSFHFADGRLPYDGLVLGTDGNFYGTASAGSAVPGCSVHCGTVFRITPQGTLTTLHSFNGSDGYAPMGGLVEATDGNFYGQLR